MVYNPQTFYQDLGGSSVIDEWMSQTGQEHNREWMNAAPGEYWARRMREAQSWKRNQLDIQAQKDAELTRQRVEGQKKSMQDALSSRYRDFQRAAGEQRGAMQTLFGQYQNQIGQLQNTYKGKLAEDNQALSGVLSGLMGAYDTAYSGLANKAQQSLSNYDSIVNQAMQNSGNFNYTPDFRMVVPELYSPDFGSLLSNYNASHPLFYQGKDTLEKTYGNWNQPRLQELMTPAQGQYDTYKTGVTGSMNNLSNTVSQAPSRMQAGIFDPTGYAEATSQNASFNQQLMSMEQGLMSQISSMYNFASNFANQAESIFQTEKANRLNERQSLIAQQSEQEFAQKTSQAEQNSARQVTNRREDTGSAFNPDTLSLLSTLTRGI